MLLIVSLGYGVVKPTLGTTMNKCIALAATHFVFGALYSSSALHTAKESPLIVLFFALPVSITMSIFYFWTLTAMEETIKHLEERKQAVKLLMYKRLQWILGSSVGLLFIVLVANSVNLLYVDQYVTPK